MKGYFVLMLALLCVTAKAQAPFTKASLLRQADSLHNAGEYKNAAALYTIAFQKNVMQTDTDQLYKAAVNSYKSHSNNQTFVYLNLLSVKGYKNYQQLENDATFTKLRGNYRWKDVLYQIKQNSLVLIRPVAEELNVLLNNYKASVTDYHTIKTFFGNNSVITREIKDFYMKEDSINAIKAVSILHSYGWRSMEYFGEHGSEALIIILLHAQLPVQKTWYPAAYGAMMKG